MYLKIPLIGKIWQSYHLSSMCRTCALMLRSNGRIVETLSIAKDTTSSILYKEALTNIIEKSSQGELLFISMNYHPHLFPIVCTQMISIGDKTGELDQTFMYLSDMFTEDAEDHTQTISTLIEPALMICIGLSVGFIAISIISPIYEMTQKLSL
jgi:type IV pilus assembly protein PilC